LESIVLHASPDSLVVEAIEVDCIVGIRPAERRRPQRVRLDLTLMLDLSRAGRSGRFTHTVDYALVVEEISRLLHFREYRLVEMATEEIAGMLIAAHPLLDAVRVRLEKPEALGGRARTAAACITRARSDFPPSARDSGSARFETVLETHEALLGTLNLAPGSTLDPTRDLCARTLAWLSSGSLALDGGRRLEVGAELPSGSRATAGPEGAAVFRCSLKTA
jgi:dihydroneopterin aldolase